MKKAAKKIKPPSIEDDPLEGYTLIERAEILLGARLTRDELSYKLDGKRVASVYDVLKAAGLKVEAQ